MYNLIEVFDTHVRIFLNYLVLQSQGILLIPIVIIFDDDDLSDVKFCGVEVETEYGFSAGIEEFGIAFHV